MKLNSLQVISNVDKEKMLYLIVSFPRQCQDALAIGESARFQKGYKRKYSNIIFTGLGGSAIGADVVKGYVGNEIDIPIYVNRDYSLPSFASKDSLIFAVSYSGNTEETLSAYGEALKIGANIIVITSGGKLRDLAIRKKNTLVTIPQGYPPRCALGYSFIPAVILLSKLGMIKSKRSEIRKTAQFLENLLKKKIGVSIRGRQNISKSIANRLRKKYALIYASDNMVSVATRWRGQLAENAKTLSSSHVFPEMNHNEIVGWMHPKKLIKDFVAIILRDKDDHTRIKKRMDITASILKKHKYEVVEVESQGSTRLERILSLIYIGDFVSFYLSILNGTDPTPVDRITYLKKQLAK